MSQRHLGRGTPDYGAVRWSLLATLFGIVIVAMAVVAASPFALRLFSGADGEWQRLSFIGQTYGAISALIAVVALLGIIATLVYQARETRHAVQEARRQAMSELLEKAMDDPDLDECWGPIPEPSEPRARKQQLYINMIVSQWSVAYESGAMPEKRLRAIAREMFSARPGRTFWERARKQRLSVVTEGKKGQFNQILDEEFQQAPDPGTDVRVSGKRPNAPFGRFPVGFVAGILSGIVLGAGAALTAIRLRHGPPRRS